MMTDGQLWRNLKLLLVVYSLKVHVQRSTFNVHCCVKINTAAAIVLLGQLLMVLTLSLFSLMRISVDWTGSTIMEVKRRKESNSADDVENFIVA